MIDKKHGLPITRQAKALKLSRGSFYYLSRPMPAADLAIMRRMDELHLEFPFAGSRMLRDLLNADGFEIGRQHVATLMKRMAIEAIYRKPNTSKPTPGHMIYPYLLRKLQIDRPNQVWATDITYIPMARLRLSHRRGRLVQPQGFILAGVDHDGGGVLYRGAGGSASETRHAGHLQHRSR
jgi:putative transposase